MGFLTGFFNATRQGYQSKIENAERVIREHLKAEKYNEAIIEEFFMGLQASPALYRIYSSPLFLELITNFPSYFVDFIQRKESFEQHVESYIVNFIMYIHMNAAVENQPDLFGVDANPYSSFDNLLKGSHRYLVIALQQFAWYLHTSQKNAGKLNDVDLITHIKSHGASLKQLEQKQDQNESTTREMTLRLHQQMIKMNVLTSPDNDSQVQFASPWFFKIFLASYCVDNLDGEQWLNKLTLTQLAGQQQVMAVYLERLVEKYYWTSNTQENQKLQEKINCFFSHLVTVLKTNCPKPISGESPVSEFMPRNVDDFHQFHLVFLTCWDIGNMEGRFLNSDTLTFAKLILQATLLFAVQSNNPFVKDEVINLRSLDNYNNQAGHLISMLKNSATQIPTIAFLAERKRGLRPPLRSEASPIYTVLLQLVKTVKPDSQVVLDIKKIAIDSLLDLIKNQELDHAKEFIESELVHLIAIEKHDLEPYLKFSRGGDTYKSLLDNLFESHKKDEQQTLNKR